MRTIKQEHYFPIIIAIHFVFWVIDLYLYNGSYEYTSKHIAGEVFSSWVVTVFAANFLMATRATWVEKIFGGLDKMFLIHRRSGVIAIVLLLFHFVVVPRDASFTIGKPMGFYSLVLILIGVIVAAVPLFKRKFKYHKWISFHKLMGIFYVLGIAHSVNVPTLTSELPIVRAYVYLMALIGIVAWFYKAFLYNLFNKKLSYNVTAVKRFSNDMLEIILKPLDKKLAFEAGQFAFVSFKGINKNESHPFTISGHPSDDNLRLTVKALGDYTADLQTSLEEGTSAKVEGPFGLFNFKTAKHKKQLWLAGGIGITPFLSFIKEVDDNYDTTLVWSIKTIEQANYKEEIENITDKKSNLKFVLSDTENQGHFSIDNMYKSVDLKNTSVFICGPEVMRESYIKQLLQKGVSINDIHYEEFSFR
ncbi:MAG: hypothetical protein GY936_02240 [Ignavibacteriae bacterium]|nr:hypothetical protein [Ignavibacteriota bacterium]